MPTPASTATSTAQAVPTRQPTPTPLPNLPIPPEIRDLAREVDSALQRKDITFFQQAAVTTPITCEAKDVPVKLGGPACESVGQQFNGFPLARWGSEGNVIPIERALELLSRIWGEAIPQVIDQYGSGEPKVFAIGPSSVVLTSLITRPPNFAGSGPVRMAIVTHWQQNGSAWRFTQLTAAGVLGVVFLVPEPEGVQYLRGWEKF